MSIDIEQFREMKGNSFGITNKINYLRYSNALIKALEQQQEDIENLRAEHAKTCVNFEVYVESAREEIKARDEVIEYLLKYYPYNSTVERLLQRVYKLKQWNKSRDKPPKEQE